MPFYKPWNVGPCKTFQLPEDIAALPWDLGKRDLLEKRMGAK